MNLFFIYNYIALASAIWSVDIIIQYYVYGQILESRNLNTPQINHRDININLLLDCIILAFLEVKNWWGVGGGHAPHPHTPLHGSYQTLWLGTLSHFKARSTPAITNLLVSTVTPI